MFLLLQGIKGDRGERGSTAMVAFSVHRGHSLTATTRPERITYDAAFVNHGRAFNVESGIFTCPIPGLYYFSFTFKTAPREYMGVRIKQNGRDTNSLYYSSTDGEQTSVSQSIILDLDQGDRVWLELYLNSNRAKISGTSSKINTFNGYLIHPK